MFHHIKSLFPMIEAIQCEVIKNFNTIFVQANLTHKKFILNCLLTLLIMVSDENDSYPFQ
jgi:hypothetical protein